MKATANLLQTCVLSSSIFLTATILAEETKSDESSAKVESTRKNPFKKSHYDADEGFGSPDETGHQLEEDNKDKFPIFRFPIADALTEDWDAWKARLYDDTGFQFGIAYTAFAQKIIDPDVNTDNARSGLLRASIKWELVNRGSKNVGALVMSFDDRHKYGDIPPAQLGGSIGYLSQTGMLYNDAGSLIGDLKWTQALNDGKAGMVIGRYDPSDYHDVLGFSSPWTGFSNLDSLINMSIAVPDWSWGVAAGFWLSDEYYVLGGVNDANGTATDDLEFFDYGSELYKFAEVGWSPSREQRYFNNFHLMLWHVDEREIKGPDSDSQGMVVGYNWTWDMEWMVFAKLGLSDADSTNDVQLYEQHLSAGVIKYFDARSDLVGLSISHGKIIEPLYDLGGFNEYTTTIETFYRIQLAENIAITPNLQYIIDPHNNTDIDSATIAGVRVRFTL